MRKVFNPDYAAQKEIWNRCTSTPTSSGYIGDCGPVPSEFHFEQDEPEVPFPVPGSSVSSVISDKVLIYGLAAVVVFLILKK